MKGTLITTTFMDPFPDRKETTYQCIIRGNNV